MQKEKIQKNIGISLVETIIYVAIFSMIVTAFASFTNSITTSRLHNQRVLEVNDQGQKIMKMITQTIRNSNEVITPTIGNSGASLNLTTYNPSLSPTIFTESLGVLYVEENSGGQIALTNNKVIVSDLLFSNFSLPSTADIIKVSFKLSSLTAGGIEGNYSFTFNGSAQLRK
jgi:type II secretory pathway pseudopilin PulG